MFLIVDNYDSFTFNIAHALQEGGARVRVERCDRLREENVAKMAPRAVLIGSGAGDPEAAGVSVPLIRALAGRIPVLGVGLGLLCIARAFGAVIAPNGAPVHGKREEVVHDGRGLLADLPSPLGVVRYDSLHPVEPLPPVLTVTARAPRGEVMGLRHRSLPLEAVQYHPASVLSDGTEQWVANVLRWAEEAAGRCAGPRGKKAAGAGGPGVEGVNVS